MKRNPNGFGGVTKLSGNRSKPYMAYLNEKVVEGTITRQSEENSLKAKFEALKGTMELDNLAYILDASCGWDRLIDFAESELKRTTFKAKYRKRPIGYFKTSKEANIALAKYSESPYEISNPSFAEVYKTAYEDKKINSLSYSSRTAYALGFKKCASIHDMKIRDIKLAHLQRIINSMPEMSASSYQMVMIVMRLVFDYAVKNDLVTKNYAEYVSVGDVKNAKEKKPFTKEEISSMRDDGTEMGRMLLVLIYTGMRIGEYLQCEEADIKEDILHVRGTKTKSSDRLVAIHPSLEFVFCKYTYDTFRNRFISYMNEKEMKHNIHDTRHTFATMSTGMNQILRMYMLGHSNKNITDDIYTHPEILIDNLRREILLLDI